MNRMLEFQNIESLKKTMLMHEEIFKHQVEELHRLYNLQKKLMQQLKVEQASTTTKETAKSHTDNNANSERVLHQARTDHTVTGSSSGDISRLMPIKFDLQTPLPSQQFKNKVDEDSDDLEMELTLSIGHCSTKKRSSKTQYLKQCSTQFLDFDQSNQDGNEPISVSSSRLNTGKVEDEGYGEARSGSISNNRDSSSADLNQESRHPQWLFQDLSLNRR